MLVSASLSVVLVTESVAPELFSAVPVSGKGDDESVTEPVPDEGDELARAAVLASWWRAARCLLRSLSDGPRWRGR